MNQKKNSPKFRNIVRLFSTTSEIEAELLCQRLHSEGIGAQVVGQHLNDGLQGTAAASSVEIWIPGKQLKPAQKLFQDWGVESPPSSVTEPLAIIKVIAFLLSVIGLLTLTIAIQDTSIGGPWALLLPLVPFALLIISLVLKNRRVPVEVAS